MMIIIVLANLRCTYCYTLLSHKFVYYYNSKITHILSRNGGTDCCQCFVVVWYCDCKYKTMSKIFMNRSEKSWWSYVTPIQHLVSMSQYNFTKLRII